MRLLRVAMTAQAAVLLIYGIPYMLVPTYVTHITQQVPLPENYFLRALGMAFVILAYLELQIAGDLVRYQMLTRAYWLLPCLFSITMMLQGFVTGFSGAPWFWWLNSVVSGVFTIANFGAWLNAFLRRFEGPRLAFSWNALNTVLMLAATVAAAIATGFAAKYSANLVELQQTRFSELEVGALKSSLRGQAEVRIQKLLLIKPQYVLLVKSKATEGLQNLAVSLRAIVRDQTGENTYELELGSLFESFLHPSDEAYQWDLTRQVELNLQLHGLRGEADQKIIGFVVFGEWDSSLRQLTMNRIAFSKFFRSWEAGGKRK